MPNLDGGITRDGEGTKLNILGQTYYIKAWCESTFAFETNSEPGQHVPVHVHPTQDEFILVQEGELDLKLDGVWSKARAGDLVRMPKVKEVINELISDDAARDLGPFDPLRRTGG